MTVSQICRELDEIMYRKAFEEDSDMQKWDSGCWIRYKLYEDAVAELKARYGITKKGDCNDQD